MENTTDEEVIYKKLTNEEHVLQRPEVWIGSISRYCRTLPVFDMDTRKIVKKMIDIPDAFIKIFLEILANAADSCGRATMFNVDPKEIVINIENDKISIENYGLSISTKFHEEYNIHIPELIFGVMLTSSNYDDTHERLGIGKNGIGAKATNIFSKYFEVYIINKEEGLIYKQSFENNMKIKNRPIIKKNKKKLENLVRITFIPDFERFGYNEEESIFLSTSNSDNTETENELLKNYDQKFTKTMIELFARYSIETSFTCKIPIIFNEIKYDVRDIENFANLYIDKETISKSDKIKLSMEGSLKNSLPEYEILIINSHEDANIISFVNGMLTPEHGIHVNPIITKIKTVVDNCMIEHFFKKTPKRLLTKGMNEQEIKKLEEQKKKEKSKKISKEIISKSFFIIVSVRVVNPTFTSQSKTMLKTPKVNYKLDNIIFDNIKKWSIIDYFIWTIKKNEEMMLIGKESKKKYSPILGVTSANFAGTNKSMDCILTICEGKSAMEYIVSLLGCWNNSRDTYGTFPIRGKPINAGKAPIEKLIGDKANREYANLKIELGLIEGEDYNIEDNRKKLRYGHLMIFADADVDGYHIIGLLLANIKNRFPGLLNSGFVSFWQTKIYKATYGKDVHKFYSIYDFEQWRKTVDNIKKWKIKSYKGLASSDSSEIVEDFKEFRTVKFLFDDETNKSIDVAFNTNMIKKRKQWILQWSDKISDVYTKAVPISKFINTKVCEYSVANLHRLIPSAIDGLKDSQRKILYAMFELWKGTGKSLFKKSPESVKIVSFTGECMKLTHYDHGDASMNQTIIKMAQSFVGTNNLSYFYPDGRVGNRLTGRKGGEPRYVRININNFIEYIFRKEDFILYEKDNIEDSQVEPYFYSPIIPMCLVNGATAVASGFSTFIPNHSPGDIINALIEIINGGSCPKLSPWYREFNGEITIKNNISETEELITENDVEIDITDDNIIKDMEEKAVVKRSKGLSMITKGKIEIDNNNIHITELPIGIWTKDYKDYLTNLFKAKIIGKVITNSSDTKVSEKFRVKDVKMGTLKKLRLTKSYGLNNMVLLDLNRRPIKFDGIEHIMMWFYENRLKLYRKRQKKQIIVMKDEVNKILEKIIVMKLFLENRDNFINRSDEDINSFLIENDASPAVFNRLSLSSVSKNNIKKLKKEYKDYMEEIEKLRNTDVKIIWLSELEELKNILSKDKLL